MASGILCDNEKLLFDAIQKGNTGQVISLLNSECQVDCVDDQGMSPLQHAAYRGNKQLCDVLLDAGANVNHNGHTHAYTALMFAALAGSREVCARLLEAGASSTAVNSVGRNAAQMAAFVGNHLCVSLINNYIPLSSVEYYARIQGLETEARLSRHLVTPLHRLLLRANVHPVAVALYLADQPALYRGGEQTARVLRLMCEREVKRSDANEVLALKYHFLAFFVDACRQLRDQIAARNTKRGTKSGAGADGGASIEKTPTEAETTGNDAQSTRQESKSVADASEMNEKPSKTIENESKSIEDESKCVELDDVIRHWLKTRDTDGVQENMEKLVRAGIRDFPYPQCTIVQQLVRGLAAPASRRATNARPEEEAAPTALALLTSSLSGIGPRAEDDGQCDACGAAAKLDELKRCAACRAVRYCDRRCQRLHWGAHRKWCARLGEEVRLEERLRLAATATDAPQIASGKSEGEVADRQPEVGSGAATVDGNDEEVVQVEEFDRSVGDTSPEE